MNGGQPGRRTLMRLQRLYQSLPLVQGCTYILTVQIDCKTSNCVEADGS